VASRRRRKRVIKAAKGYRGRRSKLYRYAKDAVRKAMQYNYRDRKNRKRTFRRLWQVRINAAARANGLTYSRFIEGCIAAGIEVDRKVLSDIALRDQATFNAIFAKAKAAIEAKKGASLKKVA
jgi:large subunit ribosomal protein L20